MTRRRFVWASAFDRTLKSTTRLAVAGGLATLIGLPLSAKPAQAEEAAGGSARPMQPKSATVRSAPASNKADPRCQSIRERSQLGEDLSGEDRAYLRTNCS